MVTHLHTPRLNNSSLVAAIGLLHPPGGGRKETGRRQHQRQRRRQRRWRGRGRGGAGVEGEGHRAVFGPVQAAARAGAGEWAWRGGGGHDAVGHDPRPRAQEHHGGVPPQRAAPRLQNGRRGWHETCAGGQGGQGWGRWRWCWRWGPEATAEAPADCAGGRRGRGGRGGRRGGEGRGGGGGGRTQGNCLFFLLWVLLCVRFGAGGIWLVVGRSMLCE